MHVKFQCVCHHASIQWAHASIKYLCSYIILVKVMLKVGETNSTILSPCSIHSMVLSTTGNEYTCRPTYECATSLVYYSQFARDHYIII
jgi:hypothetical protein